MFSIPELSRHVPLCILFSRVNVNVQLGVHTGPPAWPGLGSHAPQPRGWNPGVVLSVVGLGMSSVCVDF